MSERGSVNQIQKTFRDFIRQTAMRGQVDPEGNLIGTRKITGYVAAIHEDGELAGTIDVQEFNDEAGDYEFDGAGLHKGVKLCATKVNDCGVLIVPLMFSEVVIVQNPSNQEEYVIAWSHAKAVQVKSHETIQLGVVEHEAFNESDDGLEKDYDELEETGKKSVTDYTAESIRDEVSVDGDGLVEEKTATRKTIEVGDTKITIDGSTVTIETSGSVTIKGDNQTVEGNNVTVKGQNVEITGGKLTVKGTSNVDGLGPFNVIKACPFSGAPHGGSVVSGT